MNLYIRLLAMGLSLSALMMCITIFFRLGFLSETYTLVRDPLYFNIIEFFFCVYALIVMSYIFVEEIVRQRGEKK